jgi:hypothetical protein
VCSVGFLCLAVVGGVEPGRWVGDEPRVKEKKGDKGANRRERVKGMWGRGADWVARWRSELLPPATRCRRRKYVRAV